MEYTTKIPAGAVLAEYPLGKKVILRPDHIWTLQRVWNADFSEIEERPWEVMNHYYLVGSRKKIILCTIVGIEYEHWRTVFPYAPSTIQHSYINLPENTSVSRAKAKLFFSKDMERKLNREPRYVTYLYKWANGVYEEENDGILAPRFVSGTVMKGLLA